jgi:SH3-like domain-containing protein
VALHARPETRAGLVAQAAAGVLAQVERCDGEWCELDAGGYDGFIEQSQLWGVYPGEKVD